MEPEHTYPMMFRVYDQGRSGIVDLKTVQTWYDDYLADDEFRADEPKNPSLKDILDYLNEIFHVVQI